MLIFFIASITLLATIVFFFIEKKRTIKQRDCFTIFFLIYFIQILLPVNFFNINYLFSDRFPLTSNFFFDKVLQNLTDDVLAVVSSLSILFYFLCYFFMFKLNKLLMVFDSNFAQYQLRPRKFLLMNLLFLGLASGFYLIYSLSVSGDLLIGYANLISFRSLDPSIERNFINSNLFSLTQTFLFVGLLVFYSHGYKGNFLEPSFYRWIFFIIIIFLAIFCVSRRSLAIPFLIIFFTSLLMNKRYSYTLHVFSISILSLIVFFGKDVLSFLSGSNNEISINQSLDIFVFFTKVFCDIGISVVESYATFMYMSDFFRFGQDHIYSILQRIPDGLLGFDLGLPERIVRVSTETFTDSNQADIPPGFIGQMWIDFKIFGPVIYSCFYVTIFILIERLRQIIKTDYFSSVVFVIIVFFASLPLNSGSLDFNFSIDVIFLFVFLLITLKFEKIR